MEELIKFILQKITSHPDHINIEREELPDSNTVIFNIRVHPEDIGFVIGKNGKVIKSIRNLVNVIGLPHGTRVKLNLREISDQAETTSPPPGS